MEEDFCLFVFQFNSDLASHFSSGFQLKYSSQLHETELKIKLVDTFWSIFVFNCFVQRLKLHHIQNKRCKRQLNSVTLVWNANMNALLRIKEFCTEKNKISKSELFKSKMGLNVHPSYSRDYGRVVWSVFCTSEPVSRAAQCGAGWGWVYVIDSTHLCRDHLDQSSGSGQLLKPTNIPFEEFPGKIRFRRTDKWFLMSPLE